MGGRNVGSKVVSDRDWLFGSRPRRLLLEGTLGGRAPRSGWNKTELAAIAGVTAHGGVDEHVTGLIAIGLLEPAGRRLAVVTPRPALAGALCSVVRELRHVPDERRRQPTPPAHELRPMSDRESATSGEPDRRIAARELRRARSAVLRAAGISGDTRERAIAILDQALSEVTSGRS